MAGGGLWRKTLVYFGLADEDEEYYDDLPGSGRYDDESYADSYTEPERGRGKVRPLPDRPRRPQEYDRSSGG